MIIRFIVGLMGVLMGAASVVISLVLGLVGGLGMVPVLMALFILGAVFSPPVLALVTVGLGVWWVLRILCHTEHLNRFYRW